MCNSPFVKPIVKGLTTTVIFFVLTEIGLATAYAVRNAMVRYVPLPYAFGDDYGPAPPWLDRLQILKNDPKLIWRGEPNGHRTYLDVFSPVHVEADRMALLRRFTPTIPSEFRGNPTWEIRLNSEGYRGNEMTTASTPGTIRIVCIGDSWTFGMPVNQDETYPSRLAASLQQELPVRGFDVQNLGVLGYSSFQGVQVLRTRVLDLKPSIIVIGFGMNDSEVAGYRDKDMVGEGEGPPLGARIKGALKSAVKASEDYKLLAYTALVLRFRPKPIETYLNDRAQGEGSGGVDYGAIEPWTRVSPRDYESNLREMIGLARHRGAQVVLVDNELWDASPYRLVLERLSAELDVPLVDSLAMIAAARERIERQLEAQFGLRRGAVAPKTVDRGPGMTTVVFRVSHGAFAVPRALSIIGSDSPLGSSTPNRILMHDDGMSGDETAGDGVWSYTATLPRDKSVSYVYTNSGAPGRWEGLDVPHIRRVVVPPSPAGRPVYLPIETFGRVYMQGDDWHTNAEGYDLIGHAVARAVVRLLSK